MSQFRNHLHSDSNQSVILTTLATDGENFERKGTPQGKDVTIHTHRVGKDVAIHTGLSRCLIIVANQT